MEKRLYSIQTFGCQMNIHDSEKIAGTLKELGFEETLDKNLADIIVFNTCCIRESAEKKIMAKIGDIKNLKRHKKSLVIVVCGCMTQQSGMADILKKKFPFISLIIGTHNLEELKTYLTKYFSFNKPFFEIWESEKEIREDYSILRTSKFNAWVNIVYGCNNFCTYCVVPYVRGRERSRKIENIKLEVEKLVKTKKYKIITLLGQNVNSYGKDLDKTNFVTLLKELCLIKGNFKIKFLTSHPKDFSNDLVEFIAQNPKMSKSIHLPVQSGSDKILKIMNRKYTIAKYKTLIDLIYSKIPNATITTDIIVGFPGETKKDFEETCELLRYCRFSGVFGFVYSKRKGTPAENFKNQVSFSTKRQRITKLFDIQRQINSEQIKQMIGLELEVLVEKLEKGFYISKTDNKTIKIKANKTLKIGEFYTVKISKTSSNQLIGTVVDK